MDRIIFHIDVNSAFLSWTAVDLLNKGYEASEYRCIAAFNPNKSRGRRPGEALRGFVSHLDSELN